jgi:hypothetical protein
MLAGLAVVGAAGVVALRPQPNRITQENCDRIHPGMTRAEVVAIVGQPGDKATGPLDPVAYLEMKGIDSDGNQVFMTFQSQPDFSGSDSYWSSDEQVLIVEFFPGDRVCVKYSGPYVRVQQSAHEYLLWRAKRQWHCWFP